MDNYNPDWVWYAAGILSAVAAAGYYILYLTTKERLAQPAKELEPDPAS